MKTLQVPGGTRLDVSHLKTYSYIMAIQLRIRRARDQLIDLITTILFRLLFTVTLLLLIFGLALFMFFVMHYATLPTILHVFPVHFLHSDCWKTDSLCDYPNATVTFTDGKSGKDFPLLMAGQKYTIWLDMDLPESEVEKNKGNLHLGVFMVSIDLRSYENRTMMSSSRAALMEYRSTIHHNLRLIFLSPLYLFGYLEEHQHLRVNLIDTYQEDPYAPILDAVIQIRKPHIDVYKAELFVEAGLEGLRYFMQQYPIIIGTVIVSINFVCGLILAGLSAYNRFAHRSIQDQNMELLPDDGFDETILESVNSPIVGLRKRKVDSHD